MSSDVFTDDDLKRLKYLNSRSVSKFIEWFNSDRCDALLARLEAAEVCANRLSEVYPVSENGIVKAWRKAAGK
jgi:hypothetical protein